MEESEKKRSLLPWWAWIAIPILGVATWRIFRNTSRSANRLTEDLTDSEAQAAKFISYFGVHIVAGVAFATPVLKTSTLYQIGWLARNINDWAILQRAFTTLAGGNYTILQAAETALSSSEYTAFVTLVNNALTQKRIFAKKDYAHTLYNANRYGGSIGETFMQNAFVGRCISEDEYYYYYVSWRDGVTYAASKEDFVIV